MKQRPYIRFNVLHKRNKHWNRMLYIYLFERNDGFTHTHSTPQKKRVRFDRAQNIWHVHIKMASFPFDTVYNILSIRKQQNVCFKPTRFWLTSFISILVCSVVFFLISWWYYWCQCYCLLVGIDLKIPTKFVFWCD